MTVGTAIPRPLTPYFNLLRPFSPLVWALVVASVIGCLVFFLVYFAITGPPNSTANHVWFSFRDTVGSILGQGTNKYFLVFAFLPNISCFSGSDFPTTRSLVYFSLAFVWLNYVSLVLKAYGCNFRAYLIQVDYEKSIDSDKELQEMGKSLYFTANGAQVLLLHEIRQIEAAFKETEQKNKKTLFFFKQDALKT